MRKSYKLEKEFDEMKIEGEGHWSFGPLRMKTPITSMLRSDRS